ncbi:TIR/WD40 domain-containing protein [Tetraselmis virus 1]|uniref:TIR/WD40 domain-containing protein n=1 Tax=Tetraselmis virus 1 TaxID=2060617 RepID=A0A2P0VP16_9VIRU|nr:TIR/WD40 domain-containing protein [Tetraselmis virus 1]AUF82622.1 TIR/WD40 domain-containing protein [Tetraselmis virus 1]
MLDSTIFINHSSRNPKTQKQKLYLLQQLTKAEISYWTDSDNLQGKGALEWRKEIQKAIRKSVKMVSFIDADFLCSYNCIIEFYEAMMINKPIVVVILDDLSLKFLIEPEYIENIWNEQISKYAIKEGSILKYEDFKNVIDKITSINFCMCREYDFYTKGDQQVTNELINYVNQDISYLHDLTELKLMYSKWLLNRNPDLLLKRDDIYLWYKYLNRGKILNLEEKQYIEMSKKALETKRKRKQRYKYISLLIIFFFIISLSITTAYSFENSKIAQQNEEKSNMLLLMGTSLNIGSVFRRSTTYASDIAKRLSQRQLFLPRSTVMIRSLCESNFIDYDLVVHNDRIDPVSINRYDESLIASGDISGLLVITNQTDYVHYDIDLRSRLYGLSWLTSKILAVANDKSYIIKDGKERALNISAESISSETKNDILLLGFSNITGYDHVENRIVFSFRGTENPSQRIRAVEWLWNDTFIYGGNDKYIIIKDSYGDLLYKEYIGVDINSVDVRKNNENNLTVIIGCDDGYIIKLDVLNSINGMLVTNTTNQIDTKNQVLDCRWNPKIWNQYACSLKDSGLYIFDEFDINKRSTLNIDPRVSLNYRRTDWTKHTIVVGTDSQTLFIIKDFECFENKGIVSKNYDCDGTDGTRSFDTDKEGKMIVSGTWRGYVCVWSSEDSWEKRVIADTGSTAKRGISISKSGKRIAVVADAPDGKLTVYDSKTLQVLYEYKNSSVSMRYVDWSHDDNLIAIGTISKRDNVILVDTFSYSITFLGGHTERIRTIKWDNSLNENNDYVLSSSGNDNKLIRHFILFSENSVYERSSIEFNYPITTIGLNPYNTLSALGTSYGKIIIFDDLTSRVKKEYMDVQDGSIKSLDWESATLLTSSSGDGTTIFYDIETDEKWNIFANCEWMKIEESKYIICAKVTGTGISVDRIVPQEINLHKKLLQETIHRDLNEADLEYLGLEELNLF